MRSLYEERIGEARETQRRLSQGAAELRRKSKFGKAWEGLYPFKSAEELASKTGCSIRTAAAWLSGEFPPSARAIAVFNDEITKD